MGQRLEQSNLFLLWADLSVPINNGCNSGGETLKVEQSPSPKLIDQGEDNLLTTEDRADLLINSIQDMGSMGKRTTKPTKNH